MTNGVEEDGPVETVVGVRYAARGLGPLEFVQVYDMVISSAVGHRYWRFIDQAPTFREFMARTDGAAVEAAVFPVDRPDEIVAYLTIENLDPHAGSASVSVVVRPDYQSVTRALAETLFIGMNLAFGQMGLRVLYFEVADGLIPGLDRLIDRWDCVLDEARLFANQRVGDEWRDLRILSVFRKGFEADYPRMVQLLSGARANSDAAEQLTRT